MLAITNYIDGILQPSFSGSVINTINPATGRVLATLPRSNNKDVVAAVEAAQRAFAEWSKLPGEARMLYLLKIADGIETRFHEFVAAESEDSGKPLALAEAVDIPRAVSNFRFFAAAAQQFSSESHAMPDAINYTLRQAVGVVGCISPWNLPIYLFSWKIAPALAAGNCVVAKPSEVTPLTAFLLSQVCIEAGLPKGVLNIVHGLGSEAGQAIVEHPAIKAISFTGGTATGKHIAAVAAPMFKKVSLELGGKNPTIVFGDCDFENTVKNVVRASFSNQGEICLCGSRIFVEAALYEKFKQAFVAEVNKLKVGDPQQSDTNLGAIVSEQHFNKVLSYIELAKQEGGKVLCGGNAVQLEGRCHAGFFIQPTVFENLPHTCRTQQEEIFGPVVTLTPFHTEAEVLEMANSVPYGLACSVWTSNISKANSIAEKVEAGVVWINCWLHRDLRTPFGGVKQSGVGREGGLDAMRFFTEAKNICVKY
ncbi:MAG: aldehyde dehydrogenase [Chitinophagales bacterium]|nr:aldehyde dehydrogenase [Chitinophagales bacterium]